MFCLVSGSCACRQPNGRNRIVSSRQAVSWTSSQMAMQTPRAVKRRSIKSGRELARSYQATVKLNKTVRATMQTVVFIRMRRTQNKLVIQERLAHAVWSRQYGYSFVSPLSYCILFLDT